MRKLKVSLSRKERHMKPKKILFITQEMIPYVPETTISQDGRKLPQALQEQGFEIRTFMPRWGIINERRNQLHEVIRLSGMNIIIDDTDHPLIIKVASIPAARMQVYFIDNDDYFHKRGLLLDDEGKEYPDNVERAIFYARGVLETVKKLRWCPDIIYCQSWISAVTAFYVKTAYREDPPFANTKVIYTFYDEQPDVKLATRFLESLTFRDANAQTLKQAGIDLNEPDCLPRLGIAFSDAVVEGQSGKRPELLDYAQKLGKPILHAVSPEEAGEKHKQFIDQILSEAKPEPAG